MHSQDAPWIPIFSYVGRLRDSRKGLEVFLDALALLWESGSTREFKAWVIGGSADDKLWAARLAMCRDSLRSRALSGDLVFWGHVENESLPEFYSRSAALVVPSFREQFGITAVEAMMCGCPVIAARVGGLQDVVVEDKTGNLFDRGSSSSLAAIMASYLREPSLPYWLGANGAVWARTTFDEARISSTLLHLFENPSHEHGAWLASPDSAFRRTAISEIAPRIEALIGSSVESLDDITSGPSISLKVRLEGGSSVFAKVYTNRPTDLSCLYPRQFCDSHLLIPRERILLALSLQGQSFFPDILAHDMDASLLLQAWKEPHVWDQNEARRLLREAVRLVRTSTWTSKLEREREAIQKKIATHEEASENLLDEIDLMTADLHAPLIGGSVRLRALHPQLELYRMQQIISKNEHWLPVDYVYRAKAVLSFLLSEQPLIAALPSFGHGSLKSEHLLSSLPILCDFDHAGYFCGPADSAHWIWEDCTRHHEGHPGPMLRLLLDEVADFQEWFLGVCWIVSSQIKRDLVIMTRGSSATAKHSLPFLYEFTEAFRGAYSLMRSRGPG